MTAGDQKLPFWLHSYLLPQDLESISQAVRQAEIQTSGEIIPMVVRQSTGVRHVPLLIGLIIFSGLLIFDLEAKLYDQNEYYVWMLPLFFAASYFLGALLAKIPRIAGLFLSDKDMMVDVLERAEIEFYRGRFNKTEKQTGILIFISFFEHRAVVLADKGIASRLPQQTWDEVVHLLTAELKNKNLHQGLIKAIGKCGEILAKEFPAGKVNPDEISNQLVIKD